MHVSNGGEHPTSEYDPALAPELRALQGDPRRLWSDAEERRRAIQAIVDALASDEAVGREAVERVDRAIAAGLHALGLPRGPIRRLLVEGGPGPYGRKDPDCTLLLFGDRMRQLLRDPRGPDTTFRTWVHESIHGRHPRPASYRREYARWPGYEEGLAEGLARLVVRERAGMDPIEASYDYYVVAYRALARTIGVDVERLWRRLWRSPPGQVRASLAENVDELRRERTGMALTSRQRAKLGALADMHFQLARVRDSPNEDAMMRVWRTAFDDGG